MDSWDNCYDSINDYLWWFVSIYLTLLILIKLFFVRILHAWKEQGIVRAHDRNYENLVHYADHETDNSINHGTNMH